MRRTVSKIQLGEYRVQTIIKYESDPCEKDSVQGRQLQIAFALDVFRNPELLNVGSQRFDRLRYEHNGEAWVLELEAVSG